MQKLPIGIADLEILEREIIYIEIKHNMLMRNIKDTMGLGTYLIGGEFNRPKRNLGQK